MIWCHRQIVDPAPMALVADHDRADDLFINQADEKLIWIQCELSADILSRIIPGSSEAALFPQRDHGSLISILERSDI